jgi:hypothetical protein
LLIALLCLAAFGMIFVTALLEWIVANYGGGERQESDIAIAVAFALIALIGALAAMGQPRNAVGWVLLFSGLTTGLAGLGESLGYYLLTVRQDSDTALIAAWLSGIGWVASIALLLLILPFIFPDGHLAGRRWRVVFAVVVLLTAAMIAVILFSPLFSRKYLDPAETDRLLDPLFVTFPFLALLGVLSMVARYRRADSEVRRQMKWLILTIGVPIVAFLFLSLIEELSNVSFSNTIWGLLYLLIPVGLGVSLLRYRMFDVDTVIRKTTVYAVLTLLLALVYFGVVVILQRVLSPVIGDSTYIVVLSTLLIAALFLPLRRRVQAFIDRQFYRRKYNAEKVLEQFAATVRDETDLDALTAELLRVIQETMEPEHVSIWLKPAANNQLPPADR